MNDIGSRIERLAPPGDLGTYSVSKEEALTSIAISLKRIADALWGVDGTAGALELLNPLQVRNNY